jgi:hypothetical protein
VQSAVAPEGQRTALCSRCLLSLLFFSCPKCVSGHEGIIIKFHFLKSGSIFSRKMKTLFFSIQTVPRRRTNSQASQTEPTGPTLICYKRPRDCGGPASPWAIDCYDSNPNKQTPPRRRRPQQSPPTLPRRRSWSADFPPSPSRESLLLGEQSGELPAVASAGVAQQTAVRSISG